MASSKLFPTNPDPPPVQSPSPSSHYNPHHFSSSIINMDDIITNIYSEPTSRDSEMTLEDFLTKAGAGEEAVVPVGAAEGVAIGGGTVVVGRGRGKRRAAVEEPVLDKATQQKQRRMIKNRESAARSRERKQAYTVELEALVTQLEEENARLVREEAEESKKRFNQLMENLIPVEEKRKPPRIQTLRRSNSWLW